MKLALSIKGIGQDPLELMGFIRGRDGFLKSGMQIPGLDLAYHAWVAKRRHFRRV